MLEIFDAITMGQFLKHIVYILEYKLNYNNI